MRERVLTFKQSFFTSFGGHFFIILISVVMSFWGWKKIINSDDSVEIIKAAVKVDVVAMPKLSLQELKKLTHEDLADQAGDSKPQETQPSINKNDVIEEVKSKRKSLSSLLSDYSKKEVKPKTDKKGGVVLEGNKVSQGSALVGDRSDGESSEFSLYVQALPDIIRVNWKLPTYLRDQGLKCRIKIYISNSGQLLQTQIIESSGNEDYDMRAIQALKKSAPFPVPSREAAKGLAIKGIILGFPL